MTATDLLFEIGCEELPAAFVDAALKAMVPLAETTFAELRLSHGRVRALGTPRRLALLVDGLALTQSDLNEPLMGPPVSVAFKDGQPTRAAEAFAKKVGCPLDELTRVETPKGEYLCGTLRATGLPAAQLLPAAMASFVSAIPFRKSMRWGDGDLSFGRPLRWLLLRLGTDALDVPLPGVATATASFGHRFLHPGEVPISQPGDYVGALRQAHVLVDPAERAEAMRTRLVNAASEAGGTLIEDDFLIGENLSLVEEPHIIVGSFEDAFLELPEEVILEVARDHQRYFGMRAADGKLMARYLAVANTAENPDKIRLGNDRVMRARLADARFFHREDLKRALSERRNDLAGIVFQDKLGSVLNKVERIARQVQALDSQLGLDGSVIDAAAAGAELCKCDLVTLMVGEFPGLQGRVGRAYALRQGVAPEVAAVISGHYHPKGAKDDPPDDLASALVALCDRLDTLVGCFGIGLAPTGAADPYALRRACIGVLRIVLHSQLSLSLADALAAVHATFPAGMLNLTTDQIAAVLGRFFHERLRGLLADGLPSDAVDAALGVAADRPLDAQARARAIATLDADVRKRVGEVFKRATNIAKDAPQGAPEAGSEPSERALFDAFFAVQAELQAQTEAGDYPAAFAAIAAVAAPLADYFDNVMVMADDEATRNNRLRLMRTISETCSQLARLDLLGV